MSLYMQLWEYMWKILIYVGIWKKIVFHRVFKIINLEEAKDTSNKSSSGEGERERKCSRENCQKIIKIFLTWKMMF